MAYGSYGKMKSFASEMQDFQNPHHDHAEEIATDVQTKVNKLEIIVQAMWEILQDQGVTVEQLHNKIDELVAAKGFYDNWSGMGVNYISDRMALEDMHPANVFIDEVSGRAICIDCIVKFI